MAPTGDAWGTPVVVRNYTFVLFTISVSRLWSEPRYFGDAEIERINQPTPTGH